MAPGKRSAAVLGCGATALTAAGTVAFIPSQGPRAAPTVIGPESLGHAVASTVPSGTTRSSNLVAVAAAAVSLSALAAGAGKVLAGKRSARVATTVVIREAQSEFAGGLVGGESAFGGQYNFDPLGLSTKVPKFLPWFRESELKHGRIAMLAWIGLIAPEFIQVPISGPCFSASVTTAHDVCVGTTKYAFLWSGPGTVGPLWAGFYFVGFLEVLTSMAKFTNVSNKPGGLTLENAGDYRLGIGFLPKEPEKAKEVKLKELKNGRLAMLAFAGAITQAQLTGHGFPWLYAQKQGAAASGLASSVAPAAARRAVGVRRASVARHAEAGGYKMSKAVPFLPLSPALESYVGGEEEGFDPIGVSLAIDIRWLRESELKHGRVAMLATVGWIITDAGVRVPGEAFQVSSVEAHDALVRFGALPQMLIWLGFAELFGFLAIVKMMEGKTNRAPGDFGLRLLYPADAKGQYDVQLKELRNGRLAMLAYGGIATVSVLTGDKWPFFAEGSGRTAQRQTASTLCGGRHIHGNRSSGLSARAERLGSASIPFLPKPENLKGFVGEEIEFDPLGFSETFDVKWLRESELKHGRVAMLAAVGFFAQQFVTLPGIPEAPDSLQAVYTAPLPALAALLFASGFIESASYGGKITMLDMFEGTNREPGNFNFGSSFLNGKSEKDVSDMKLKELSNGRLAMFAIGGMVHHNLVVKGALFPLFPEGWAGPQGSWQVASVMTTLQVGAS